VNTKKAPAKEKPAAKDKASAKDKQPRQKPVRPRLLVRYESEVRTALGEKLGEANVMALPRLEKVIINMGVGDATQDKKMMEDATEALGLIAGQKPVVTVARQSIAGFKLREGVPIGCKVTLRGNRMYEFVDRLLSFTLPRVRDFRGVNPKAFDGRGNYSLGLNEYLVFPELNPDKFTRSQGMNIVFVTTAKDDAAGRELLKLLGMPFRDASPAGAK
jgi:large subunit ribosomal protein L5